MIISAKKLKDMAQKLRGFTMTEGAIVLGVVGLVVGAIWLAASTVAEKQKTDTGYEQVWQIANNFRALYTGQPPATVPSTVSLSCSGIFPNDMLKKTYQGAGDVCTNKTPVNVFGEPITISAYNNVTKEFTIKFDFPASLSTEKSKSACVDFISRFNIIANGQEGMPKRVNLNNTSEVNTPTPSQILSTLSNGRCNSVSLIFGL